MNQLSVKAWQEKIVIPTYGVGEPDKNPMFFDKRVYQGSSGVVYPNPVIEKIEDVKEDKEYLALYLENKYIKIMILPELGGRIQMAYDKIKQRHFIYYNQVIKPALVGLTGPWISGGIEFNWPQHHRPSTFEPVDFSIEENEDGSKTIWVNEVEKMFHTKGMAGFTLHPDKAYIEIKAKLYNRSSLPQTFLWWANPAVKVNDHYQSVFPSDVNAVFDHGKRDVSSFPIAKGTYYKVDYAPGTDISMYKNIPVPTSYMAINSDYDFVGGYEHDSQGGLLHVADHHVSPGKKQWTWGHSDFGQAWDRNLTDEDGPYIELMTGVFTDNQPDFSWLMPNETKVFTQYFMPYRELGVVKNATKDILVAVKEERGKLLLRVYGTSIQADIKILLKYDDHLFLEEQTTLSPDNVFVKEIPLSTLFEEDKIDIKIFSSSGKLLLEYVPANNRKNEMPQAAQPALQPNEISTCEQLFLTGQHLEQYRHATYSPIPYYEEALKRDPSDMRNNNALGLWHLRRGRFEKCESYFRKAIETITKRNPNPYDSEAYYNLGLSLKYQKKYDEAYDAFFKASWSVAWKASGFLQVAQIDLLRGDNEKALEHSNNAIDFNALNSKAYVLKIAALRKLNQPTEALKIVSIALQKDHFNLGVFFEKSLIEKIQNKLNESEVTLQKIKEIARADANNFIEYSLDYMDAGLYDEAIQFLTFALFIGSNSPMIHYYLGWLYAQINNPEASLKCLQEAASANAYLCFPNRLQDIPVLRFAMEENPEDAKASYYLGNLFYDKRQYSLAINYWEMSASLDNHFPTVFRNLGIAYFNKTRDTAKALSAYEKAFSLDKSDARVLMELDQLYKRLNYAIEKRLAFLEENIETTNKRDDTYLERLSLYNFQGNHLKALSLLNDRQFHPWEGGEGKVSGQYLFALIQEARENIKEGNFDKAIELLNQAKAENYPHNLGEGKLYGTQDNEIYYWLGCAYDGMEYTNPARQYFEKAAMGNIALNNAMFYNDQPPYLVFYQALALKKLGRQKEADILLNHLIEYGNTHIDKDVKIDYFAVSLPNLLIFDDDLNVENKIQCLFLKGLGYLGLGDKQAAFESFEEVLAINCAHLSTKSHLKLI